MDGIHDLGGMQGFGPVEVEPDEPTFHGEWEARMFAVAGERSGPAGSTPRCSATPSSGWIPATT